jgi:hypothetical protein
MRITNWGLFLLGVYLILAGLTSLGFLYSLSQITTLIGVVAGVLLIMENSRR